MKTYRQLGIELREHRALQETRDYLRGPGRECLIPSSETYRKLPGEAEPETPQLRFNMGLTSENYHCGTVGCIGGHVALILQGRELSTNLKVSRKETNWADNYVDAHRYDRLRALYFPFLIPEDSWDRITPAIAAQAIDNYLNTGDPSWESLAEEHGLGLEGNVTPDL